VNAFTVEVGWGFDVNVETSDFKQRCDFAGAPAHCGSGRSSVALLCDGVRSMKWLRIAFVRRAGSPDVAAARFPLLSLSQYVIAASRIVLALAATFCVASMSYAQSGRPKGAGAILPDAALLIHGPFGEDSYKLTSTADDSVTLEEFGDRRMRLEIRQIPDKRCVFVSTREQKDGFDVVQLDLTKFDGTYQLWEACGGPAFGLPENRCTYSLHFSSQKQAFCSSRFPKLDFDLSKTPFPDGACQPYALGAREKKFYTKYIDAYERIKEQCGGGQ
jgi:hypothetical protein